MIPTDWEAAGEPVTATVESAFLSVPSEVDTHSKIYRVWKIE
jgi:hypothetical protein